MELINVSFFGPDLVFFQVLFCHSWVKNKLEETAKYHITILDTYITSIIYHAAFIRTHSFISFSIYTVEGDKSYPCYFSSYTSGPR